MNFALLSGAHSHTAGYMKEIKKSDDLNLVAVWDDMESRGRAIAEDMGCEFVPNLDDVLGRGDLDATCVCADNLSHRPLVEASALAGIDCFCEKPMAVDLANADSMIQAVQDAGIVCVFGYMTPYSGAALAAKKIVDEGRLGAVTQLHFRNAHHAAYGHWFDTPDREWFHTPEKSGGGAFLDMGTHAVHFVRKMFGPVKAVQAVIENKSAVYPRVDDFGIAFFEFESGATGVIEASWVFTGGPRGLEAIGSRGRLDMGEKLQFTPFTDKPGEPEPLAEEPAQPTRMMRLVAIKNGVLDRSVADEDMLCCRDAVAIMAACYEAARTGQRQEVMA